MKSNFLLFLILVTFRCAAQIPDLATVSRQVDSLIEVSRIHTENHDFDEALVVAAAAEEIARSYLGTDSDWYSDCCFNHGRILHIQGKYSEAEDWYMTCFRIREKKQDQNPVKYAEILNNLGFLYWHLARYEIAEPFFLQAKTIREKTFGTDHPAYAESLHNLAILYFFRGDYEKSEPLYLESRAIREKTLGRHHPDYAWSLNNLANLYQDLGRYEESEALHLEAKSIWEFTLGVEHPYYAEALNNLGYLYWQMGFPEKAEPLYLQARTIRKKVLGAKHPSYGASLHNLGALYLETGRYEQAEQLYLEILSIKEEILGREHHSYASSLRELGNLYRQMDKDRDSESLYLEAQAIREKVLGRQHPEYGESVRDLIGFYWKKDHPEKTGEFLTELVYLNQNLLTRSLHHLSEWELNQYLRKFSEDQDLLFSFSWAPDHKNDDIARLCFDNSLFHKGFVLNASRQIKRIALSDPVSSEKYFQLSICEGRLAAEYAKPISERSQVSELVAEAIALEKDLVRSIAGYGEAIRQFNWREVKAALQPGQIAIEFIHFRYRNPGPTDSILYAALLLRPEWDTPRWISLCEEKQLQEAFITSHTSRGEQNSIPFPEPRSSSPLYDLLWQPITPFLNGIEKVYFSPSGLLHRIPLAAIPTREKETIADRYLLHQMGSTRKLAEGTTKENLGITAVLFGGVRYEPDSIAMNNGNSWSPSGTGSGNGFPSYPPIPVEGKPWSYLPWTEVEAKIIDAILKRKGLSSSLHLGFQATEETFRQIGADGPSPRILHVATHGFFFPDPASAGSRQPAASGLEPVFRASEHPMIRSGLLLAGANHAWMGGHPLKNQEDGILTAYEVSQMDLQETELVVLSACETGLGDIEGSEGVYGLQRAFKMAGARFVLMSLWEVPDYVTQELMTAFYLNWLERDLPIPEAFRKAQQQIRENRREPFYWAGFVLME